MKRWHLTAGGLLVVAIWAGQDGRPFCDGKSEQRINAEWLQQR
jgi:hypothetical protein